MSDSTQQSTTQMTKTTQQPTVVWSSLSDGTFTTVSYRLVVYEPHGSITYEKSTSNDAMGNKQWIGAPLTELPAGARRFIIDALLTRATATQEPTFQLSPDDAVSEIVKNVVGMPVSLAARVMSMALNEQEHAMSSLRKSLVGRCTQAKGEGPVQAAVRLIGELSLGRSKAEAELSILRDKVRGMTNLVRLTSSIGQALIEKGSSMQIPGNASPCEAAEIVMRTLASALRETVVVSETTAVTTTMAVSRPAFG